MSFTNNENLVCLDAAVDRNNAHALASLAQPRRRVGDEELRLLDRDLGGGRSLVFGIFVLVFGSGSLVLE